MARGLSKVSTAAAFVCVASVALLYNSRSLSWGTTVLSQECASSEGVLVEHGYRVSCSESKRAAHVTRTSLSLKHEHKSTAHVHQEWCERWCVLEKTNADCSSCVKPSFPGYMARMKASEKRAAAGWGIHIPSKAELRILDGARSISAKRKSSNAALSSEAQAAAGVTGSGIDSKDDRASSRFGVLSPGEQVAAGHFAGRDVSEKTQLYEVGRNTKTKETVMEALESSESADESRLMADEERLARDRAIKHRILTLKLQHQHQRQLRLKQQHTASSSSSSSSIASFLASRVWHHADANAVSHLWRAPNPAPPARHVQKGNAAGSHKRARDERDRMRRAIKHNLDPHKMPMLAVHLGHKIKLPKLDLSQEYALPGFSHGLTWSAADDGTSSSQSGVLVPRSLAHQGCGNAFNCFGSLFEGKDLDKGDLFDAPTRQAQVKIRDPKAYIKGQGLGCHSLGGCLGSFFQGQKSRGAQARAVAKPLSNPLKKKMNLDGWNTEQFTRGLENGMNMFPPDEKEALLQLAPSHQTFLPVTELVKVDDGNSVVGGFLGDDKVAQQFGEAPQTKCCGGGADVVAPMASLGYGVWKFGQDVKNAQVWKPLADGLQGLRPFQDAEPVIKTGDFGLEPAPVAQDPTGTGRF